jgi:hypothetical protein
MDFQTVVDPDTATLQAWCVPSGQTLEMSAIVNAVAASATTNGRMTKLSL